MVNAATDQQLLRDYADRQSQAGFAEVVRRHVDLVFSAARRLVVDVHLAEEITQGVFVALARQSGLVARKIGTGTPLSGWLHVTTRNLAVATIRMEQRRRVREQEAAAMEERSAPENEADWEGVAPHLDHALAELEKADRDALLLRFFERQSAREIGERLGWSEEAAQKRVSRALERLRGVLVARGLAVRSTSLAVVLTVNAVQTAPAGLVGSITAGVTALVTSGTFSTLSTLGILKLMASTKLKLSVAALLVAGATGTLVLQQRENRRLHSDLAALQAADDPTVAVSSPTLEATPAEPAPSEELLRLRGEVARLRLQGTELERVRRENERLQAARPNPASSETAEEAAEEEFKRMGRARLDYTKSWGLTFWKYADANNDLMPARLEEAAALFEADDDSGGLTPDHFELVYRGSLKATKDPSRTIVLREKEPFPSVGRPGWNRTYLFADGHSEIHYSESGDFQDWERDRMVPATGQ